MVTIRVLFFAGRGGAYQGSDESVCLGDVHGHVSVHVVLFCSLKDGEW